MYAALRDNSPESFLLVLVDIPKAVVIQYSSYGF